MEISFPYMLKKNKRHFNTQGKVLYAYLIWYIYFFIPGNTDEV